MDILSQKRINKLVKKEYDELLLIYRNGCEQGDIALVEFVLTSPLLKKRIDIHQDKDYGLRYASIYGHLDLIDFLLTSPNLFEHADMRAKDYRAFKGACHYGHIDIVDYFLHSPRLEFYPSIHLENDYPLIKAYDNYHFDLVRYFIFDQNIPLTEDIISYMSDKEELKQMFELRALNSQLKIDMGQDNQSIHKKKI